MKYQKTIILLITILLSTGCIFEKEVTTVINTLDDLNIEYGEDVYLYDLINIVDGSIKDQNYLVDTENLGEHTININYTNSNKKKQKYTLTYNVIDNIKPMLSVPKNIYITLGSDTNLLNKANICGDNADRNVSFTIEGDYDINTLGSYPLVYKAEDSSGNINQKETTLHVVNKTTSSSNNSNPSDDGTSLLYYLKNYKQDNNIFGIDVSEHQKEIDFNQVKDTGIEFVIIRMGFGPNDKGEITKDKYFDDNYLKAKEAGLKIGYYFFSYATLPNEIDIETNWIHEQLKDKQVDLGIAYDWESWNTFHSCNMNFKDLNDQATRFLNNLKEKGYEVYLYGSQSKLKDIWTIDKYPIWLAQYNKEATYDKDFKIWQITDEGLVDGVEGKVDINILYK